MERKERLRKAYDYLRLTGRVRTQKDLADQLGATPPHISSAMKGEPRYLTDNLLMRLQSKFPIFNLQWLLDETGEMCNSKEIKNGVDESPNNNYIDAEKITYGMPDLKRSSDTPYTGTKEQMKSNLAKAAELLSEEEPTWSYDRNVGKPYYNVDFRLGFDIVANNQTVNPDYMIDFEPFNKCDCWCNATGKSMQPTISDGDKIAIKEVRDPKSCLINDEIYAIVTTNDLRTIKRVRDNGDTITLIPDNKECSEQTIKKEFILKVFKVIGSVKKF